MPTYYVSLAVSRPVGLDNEALMRLIHQAAERAACVPIEVTPAGLVIEAEAVSLRALEEALRELLREHGGELEKGYSHAHLRSNRLSRTPEP